MTDDAPLFRVIASFIRRGIQDGEYPSGGPVPSETELCAMFDTSRMTARRAIDELVTEGLLYRVQGSGTYVSHIELKKIYRTHGFTHNMQALGVTPSSRILVFEVAEPDGDCVQALQLGADEKIILLKRLRLADLEPMAVETVRISYQKFQKLYGRDFTSASLYDALRDEYGLEAGYSRQRINAHTLTGADAVLLFGRKSGVALHVRNIDYDKNQIPIAYADSYYHGTKYTLDVIIK